MFQILFCALLVNIVFSNRKVEAISYSGLDSFLPDNELAEKKICEILNYQEIGENKFGTKYLREPNEVPNSSNSKYQKRASKDFKEEKLIRNSRKTKKEIDLLKLRNNNLSLSTPDKSTFFLVNYKDRIKKQNVSKESFTEEGHVQNKDEKKITLLQLENESREAMSKQFSENQRKSKPVVFIEAQKIFPMRFNHSFVKRNSIQQNDQIFDNVKQSSLASEENDLPDNHELSRRILKRNSREFQRPNNRAEEATGSYNHKIRNNEHFVNNCKKKQSFREKYSTKSTKRALKFENKFTQKRLIENYLRKIYGMRKKRQKTLKNRCNQYFSTHLTGGETVSTKNSSTPISRQKSKHRKFKGELHQPEKMIKSKYNKFKKNDQDFGKRSSKFRLSPISNDLNSIYYEKTRHYKKKPRYADVLKEENDVRAKDKFTNFNTVSSNQKHRSRNKNQMKHADSNFSVPFITNKIGSLPISHNSQCNDEVHDSNIVGELTPTYEIFYLRTCKPTNQHTICPRSTTTTDKNCRYIFSEVRPPAQCKTERCKSTSICSV